MQLLELCLLLFTLLSVLYFHKLIIFLDLRLLANKILWLVFTFNWDLKSFSCSENRVKCDTLNHNFNKMPTYAPERQLIYLSIAICTYCKWWITHREVMQFDSEWLMREEDDGDLATKTNKAWNTIVLLRIHLVCCHADVLMFGKNCDYFFLCCY